MNLHSLKPAKGSTHTKKRLGRGPGSGMGGTSTRGHKGAQSRSGYSRKIGFEGGQMPLQRRIPKFGFKNINRIEYVGINLDVIQALAVTHNITAFTPEVFRTYGLLSKSDLVKILGRGEVTSKLSITAHAFSATAQKAIEAQGGEIAKVG